MHDFHIYLGSVAAEKSSEAVFMSELALPLVMVLILAVVGGNAFAVTVQDITNALVANADAVNDCTCHFVTDADDNAYDIPSGDAWSKDSATPGSGKWKHTTTNPSGNWSKCNGTQVQTSGWVAEGYTHMRLATRR